MLFCCVLLFEFRELVCCLYQPLFFSSPFHKRKIVQVTDRATIFFSYILYYQVYFGGWYHRHQNIKFYFLCLPKRKDPAVFMSLVNNNKYDCLYTYILYAQANFQQPTNKHMQIQEPIQRSFFIISFFFFFFSLLFLSCSPFSLNLIDFFSS